MRYTLWSKEVLLGHVAADGFEDADSVGGFFHPAAAFASVGTPLLELTELTPLLGAEMKKALDKDQATADDLTAGRPGDAREWLHTNATAQRMTALFEAVQGLALELRDERGAVIPTEMLLIQRMPIPPGASMSELEKEFAGTEIEFSPLMLVARRLAP